jgi:hypothetical protein
MTANVIHRFLDQFDIAAGSGPLIGKKMGNDIGSLPIPDVIVNMISRRYDDTNTALSIDDAGKNGPDHIMTSLEPVGAQGSCPALFCFQLLLKRNTRSVSAFRASHLHAVAAHGTELIHRSPWFNVHDPVAMATSEGVRLEHPSSHMLRPKPIEVDFNRHGRSNRSVAARIAHGEALTVR